MTKVVQSSSEPLLVIVIDDETSAPKVKYKGKEITMKQSIDLHWTTDTDVPGELEYAVQHWKDMETRTIERRGE